MKSMNATRKILNATVLETERGLFQVTYRAETAFPELEEMPVYQIGIDIAQVKQGIEKIAKQLGFDGVIWDTARQTPSSGDALKPAASSIPVIPTVDEAAVPTPTATFPIAATIGTYPAEGRLA